MIMKKYGILNSDLSKVIAEIGHTDKLVICDSGLPIPENSNRIDLALIRGIPKFIDILKAILEDMVVQEAILATEIKEVSPKLYAEIKEILGDIPINYCSHEEFKKLTCESKGIVRSGEIIPYANIILISGVDF